MTSDLPRPEYPRPQFRRDDWLCLNGAWDFEFDPGDTGEHDGCLDAGRSYSQQITVPFCMESSLSGIENPPRMLSVWYRRTVDVPADWQGRRLLIHFGAVDYDAFIYASVDGGEPVEIGRHRGGFTSFSLDVTFFLGETAGKVVTFWVKARDDWRTEKPRGKQTRIAGHHGCLYSRVTGIWQTVWLEPVPMHARLDRPKLTPDLASQCIRLTQPLTAGGPGPHKDGLVLRVTVSDEQGEVREVTRPVRDMSPMLDLPIPDDRLRLWEVGDGHLYDVKIELLDGGDVVDAVDSYAGMRSVMLDDKAFKLNGKPVFQRLVLDQGWYEDGLLTAPDDAALIRDIELSMEAGFNGARLHQKVFEERFLYHADRLGYLCWGEFADWGSEIGQSWGKDLNRDTHTHIFDRKPTVTYAAQWAEAIGRDVSHPCIVGWCPLNELNEPIGDHITPVNDTIHALFLMCKLIDPSRPAIDVSGWAHRVPEADFFDGHEYVQDPEELLSRFDEDQLRPGIVPNSEGKWFYYNRETSIPYRGQPFFVSEFGGIKWVPKDKRGDVDETAWGYGESPESLEAFHDRFDAMCLGLMKNPLHMGFCYTQLTDVFQEVNGILTFDRQAKFDHARLRATLQVKAAVEA